MAGFDLSSLERNSIPPHAAEVSRLFEIGIAETPHSWHGTSVEAIIHLAEHGNLPATGSFGTEFYYFPEELGDEEVGTAQFYAGRWAEHNAVKIHVLKRLPFVPRDLGRFMWAVLESGEERDAFLREDAHQHGISMSKLIDMERQARACRSGVVLGLSADIERDFEVVYEHDNERAVRVDASGMPLQYITGIEPAGHYERDVLIKLQESAGQPGHQPSP